MSSSASQLISSIATQMPMLAIFVVGIVVALVLWSKHPKVSALAMLGLGILLLNSIGMSIVQSLLIASQNKGGGMSAEAFSRTMQVVGLVRAVIGAGGFVVLIWAIFADRPRVET